MHQCVLQIGLECQLSVEDLAYEVQHTFACCHQAELLEHQDTLMLHSAMTV
jgi:hypothetical protein